MRLNAKTTGDQPMPLQFKREPDEAEVKRLAERLSDMIAATMAKPGELGLPALLDERRLKYGIPNEAFEEEAIFDRVYVWQIQPKHVEGSSTFVPGGLIEKPETQEKRVLKESSRGVLVAAGLEALDKLNSHGVGVGHIVNINRMSPWHKLIANHQGHESHLMVLRAGDLTGSEDLVRLKKEGKVKVQLVDGEHRLTDEDGHVWTPQSPWIDDSY